MNYRTLLHIVGDEPVFDTELLLADPTDPANVHRQLSRWTASGRLYQLRRGLYALAPPYQKVRPHPFLVANRLVGGSYVSLQSALAYHGVLPEYVTQTTSVTAARPGRWDTPLGAYVFRHIKVDLFYGYRWGDLGREQHAFIASPEKALLDLIYLQPKGDTPASLRALRLQNLEYLDLEELNRLAAQAHSPKLRRAAAQIREMARGESMELDST